MKANLQEIIFAVLMAFVIGFSIGVLSTIIMIIWLG